MAARLPVVISQSVRREPAAISCEEKLITELLFTAGLDATLIGPIESMETGSTDHLCLEGLKGPFALLGWNSASDSLEQLKRLGIQGSIFDREAETFITLAQGEVTSSNQQRRIDYYRLRADLELRACIDSLKRILEDREVRAFTIQPLVKPLARSPLSIVSIATVEKKPDVPVKATGDGVVPPSTYKKTIDPDEPDEAWRHLDALVDDLDRSDV